MQENQKKYVKSFVPSVGVLLFFSLVFPAKAVILFQDDTFGTVDSDNLIIDNNNTNSGNIILQFGSTLAKTLLYSQTGNRFEFNDKVDFTNHEITTFRVENVVLPATMGNPGAGAVGKIVQLTGTGTDASSPGCTPTACSPGTYSWNGTIWKSLQGSVTTSTATKIITVGPTGRDYTTVEAAAAYCNTLSGCEMWIDPGTYTPATPVDLENVRLIGADTGLTTIAITGSNILSVRQTTFEDLTINVNSGITGSFGMNVKFNAASNSSLLFNKVDFIVGTGKAAIGSTAGTPPVTTTTLQNCAESSGAGTLVLAKASSGLNTTSSTFTVIDLISTSALKLNDWPVTIVGGSNVVNTGNIITIPDRTILVSPGMSINNAISSLVASGGSGVVKLLVGTHTITAPIVINSSNIELVGEGPGTIVDAVSAGWTGGTGGDVAAIQVGAANGATPVSNVVVRNFKLRVQPDVHGIKVNGGNENKVMDMIVQSTGIKDPGVSTHSAIVFTNSNTPIAAQRRSTATRNIINRSDVTACTTGPVAGFCWVDGIHFDGDDSFGAQTFGYNGVGGGIHDSIISENIVNETRQSSYVFTGVTSSGIFSNRVRNIGFSGGSLGLALRNSNDDTIINNTIETNNTTSTVGITLYDNVDNSSVIGNVITGGGTNFNTGIIIDNIGGASTSSNNVISGNQINGADTGISITVNSTGASVFGNQIINTVTAQIADAGVATKMETLHHRDTVNPTTGDDIADGYGVGTIWINTSTGNTFMLTNATAGAAVWSKLNYNPSTDVSLSDDFLGGTNATGDLGQLGWTQTNATVAAVNGVASHPGIFNISQAAVIARLRLGGNSSDTGVSINPSNDYDMTWIVRPNGGSVANTIKRLGMMNNASSNPPTDGIYFEYSTTAGDTTWQCVTRSGGVQTRTNSTIGVASGTWANLRMRRNGTNVEFFVNGTLRCTNSTNVPTAILIPTLQQQDTAATAGNDLDLDLFSLSITGMSR